MSRLPDGRLFIWLAYWIIGSMNEEFIKSLSTEQLLHQVVLLIDEHIALEKLTNNKEAVAQSRALLLMISKELAARSS